MTRDVAPLVFGDPAPGRSALDARRRAEAERLAQEAVRAAARARVKPPKPRPLTRIPKAPRT